jgi:glycosyltransferase involved in cell wall biosynthesis
VREYLLDVSRLVWRVWRGGLPTGIDRVCLAYVEHFASRSQAVVQRGGHYFLLSPAHSDRLFDLLRDGSARRLDLLRLAAAVWPATLRTAPPLGAIYLNVGHTGLNESTLPDWVARHRLRAVYLIHDLIPITHPQFCRPEEALKHSQRMKNVLTSAAGIIGNSRATVEDLQAFATAQALPMPPTIVARISGGRLPKNVPPRLLAKPHFVTLGTIEGRKNHLLLLDIWCRLVADLRGEAPVLVIVGQRGWKAERVIDQLDQLGELDGHIREFGTCDDEELAGWILGARALLMPSFAEGFGLPVIEALRIGTPVIASNLPVYREIAGDIPSYLDPADGGNWEHLIRSFIGESVERERQLARMKDYRAPNWDEHFAAVERWLQTL